MKHLIAGVCFSIICMLWFAITEHTKGEFEQQKAISEEREEKLWRVCLETTQDIDKCVALIKYGRKYNLGE